MFPSNTQSELRALLTRKFVKGNERVEIFDNQGYGAQYFPIDLLFNLQKLCPMGNTGYICVSIFR